MKRFLHVSIRPAAKGDGPTAEDFIKALGGSDSITAQEIIRHLKGEDRGCETMAYPSTFGFGAALEHLKHGKRVYRKGWNGKNQYIELASCISYKSPEGEIVNAQHDAIGNKCIAFVGTSGVQMGWLASQADMLAEDWMVL